MEKLSAGNEEVKIFLEEYDGWVDFFQEKILTRAKEMFEGKLCCDPRKKIDEKEKEENDLFS